MKTNYRRENNSMNLNGLDCDAGSKKIWYGQTVKAGQTKIWQRNIVWAFFVLVDILYTYKYEYFLCYHIHVCAVL